MGADLLSAGGILAAFLAGGVALFAPCCIVFLAPSYLAAAAKNRRWRLIPLTFVFAAGLVLYWLTNNVLSIAQQWWINKTIAAERAERLDLAGLGCQARWPCRPDRRGRDLRQDRQEGLQGDVDE